METLNRDLGQLDIKQKQKISSVMDLLGSDTDSSFYRCKTYQLVQDTYHISVGGQPVGQNSNIQIQIDDDDTVHYLNEYCIVADLYCDSGLNPEVGKSNYLENYALLFEGYDLQIGDVSWSFPQSRYYIQQKLSKMGKEELEKYAKGLGLKYENFANIYDNSLAGVLQPNANGIATDNYQNYTRQLKAHSFMIADKTDATAAGNLTLRNKIAVPLSIIFPCLQEFPDDCAVVTCLGQKIKMTIRTNQATDCVSIGTRGTQPTYLLRNCALLRSFTKLDAIRRDIILKSTIEYPKLNYQLFPITTITPTLVPLFPISQKDRVRGMIFAFHSKTPSALIAIPNPDDGSNSVDAANIAANLLNANATSYKNPLIYFPQIPISQITIQFGGETYTINMPSIQPFHLSPHFGDQLESYTYPLQNQMKWCYYLDLTRWGEQIDLYGSSSNQVTSIQIQIQLVEGGNSSTLCGQLSEWDGSFGNFQMVAYLETQRMFEQRNGLFQMQ